MGYASYYEDICGQQADNQADKARGRTGPCLINQHKKSANNQQEIKDIDELSQLRKQNEDLQKENRSLKSELDKLFLKCRDLEYQNKILIKSNIDLEIKLEQERKLLMKAENEQFINNWDNYRDEEKMSQDELNDSKNLLRTHWGGKKQGD